MAERNYCKRQKEKPKKVYFTPGVREEVETLLKEDYSPEQAVGILKKQGKEMVSIERVYQHIWYNKKRKGTLYTQFEKSGEKIQQARE